jgi:predicted Zn-dependent peptidase
MKHTQKFSCSLLLIGLMATAAAAQEPSGGKATSTKSVQRLNRAPVNKEVLQVKLPKPVVTTLPNGLTVLVLERHKLPTLACSLIVRAGALQDPKDLPGVAEFQAALMREGTSKRDSAQIANETDSMGATLTTFANYGEARTTIAISGLIESADKMLDLMSDIVLNPTFPDSELAKYRTRKLAALEQQRSEPSFLANERFHAVLYGDFPAAVVSATPASARGIKSADLKKFHDTWFAPNNAILGLVGDVTPQQGFELAKKYFGSWQKKPVPPAALPPLPAPQSRKVYLVNRPGSVQTNLVAGGLSLKRTDPDYIPMVVTNRILGGGAAARLFIELREEKGYTYGSYSNFSADIYPGPFQATSEQRNNVSRGAIDALLGELRKMRDEPVPTNELEEDERSLVASFALSLESPSNLINRWLTVAYYGLPMDYWDTYPAKISAVTAATVQQTAKRYIDLDHLQIVVVGDGTQPATEEQANAKTIREVLASYGPLEVFSTDGKPMTAQTTTSPSGHLG